MKAFLVSSEVYIRAGRALVVVTPAHASLDTVLANSLLASAPALTNYPQFLQVSHSHFALCTRMNSELNDHLANNRRRIDAQFVRCRYSSGDMKAVSRDIKITILAHEYAMNFIFVYICNDILSPCTTLCNILVTKELLQYILLP